MECIGIDIGSQCTKLTLLGREGKISGDVFYPYPTEYPHPYWAEQDPKQWEEAVIEGLKNIVSKSKHPAEISAIGIDAQVDGVIAVDKKGNPLYKALIWMDRRAGEEEKLIGKAIKREDLFNITGCNLDSSHVLPKILWLKRNIDTFYKTHKLLMPASYILFFLTGEHGVDYSNASSTLFFDIKKKTWSEEILSQFDLDTSLLPDIFPSTSGIGRLKKEIAKAVGLSSCPMVAVGCGDEHAAAAGAGGVEEGILLDISGTAEGVGVSSSKPLLDRSHLVETHGHASPEHWFIENPGFVSGGSLRWFRDNFCTIDKRGFSYDELTEAAAEIPAGSDGIIFLPTMMGAMVPEWNSSAKGNIYGISMNCTRAHITRAILESTAYGLKDIVEAIKDMGIKFLKVRVTGGGSRSKLWNQIKADVLDLPVETLFTPETTSFGAALIGAVCCGMYPTLNDAVNDVVKVQETVSPRKDRGIYDEMYQNYRELYFSLKPGRFNKDNRLGKY
jgi:xylulokinase